MKPSKYFVVEGEKMVIESLQTPHIAIVHIYATTDFIRSASQKNIALPQNLVTEITDKDLAKISHLKTPNHVLAVIEKRMHIPPRHSLWTVALDGIQDPGNLGTMIRTCDWFGVDKIICSESCVSSFNSKVIQAAMGSIFRVEVSYTSLAPWLQQQSKPIFLTKLEGQSFQKIAPPPEGGILLLGNESQGVSKALCDTYTQHTVCIPRQHSHTESLNVSVACGILLAHFCL